MNRNLIIILLLLVLIFSISNLGYASDRSINVSLSRISGETQYAIGGAKDEGWGRSLLEFPVDNTMINFTYNNNMTLLNN